MSVCMVYRIFIIASYKIVRRPIIELPPFKVCCALMGGIQVVDQLRLKRIR